jgi:hypothetical protein
MSNPYRAFEDRSSDGEMDFGETGESPNRDFFMEVLFKSCLDVQKESKDKSEARSGTDDARFMLEIGWHDGDGSYLPNPMSGSPQLPIRIETNVERVPASNPDQYATPRKIDWLLDIEESQVPPPCLPMPGPMSETQAQQVTPLIARHETETKEKAKEKRKREGKKKRGLFKTKQRSMAPHVIRRLTQALEAADAETMAMKLKGNSVNGLGHTELAAAIKKITSILAIYKGTRPTECLGLILDKPDQRQVMLLFFLFQVERLQNQEFSHVTQTHAQPVFLEWYREQIEQLQLPSPPMPSPQPPPDQSTLPVSSFSKPSAD